MRILIVEDEIAIAKAIRRGLEREHFQVEIAEDGSAGLKMALENSYALVILDLMLPGLNGIQVCEAIREHRVSVPILMLTARGTVPDRILGLQTGADDYLPKPFDFFELLARIQALLRRDRVHKARIIKVEDLEIDTVARRVVRSGQEIALSQREYMLLEALAAREGQILSRETIQERVWMDEESYSNVVDVYIGLLRKKIDANHEVKLIQTVRGLGYTIRRPDPEDSTLT